MDGKNSAYQYLLLAALVLPLGVMGFKLFVLNYPLAGLIPAVSYRVELRMQAAGHGEDIRISTYLPTSNHRQEVADLPRDERDEQSPFRLAVEPGRDNRIATWQGEALTGRFDISHAFSVQPHPVRYLIPDNLPIPDAYPPAFDEHLAATEGVQVNDPLIEQALAEILPGGSPGVLESLTAIHRFLQERFANTDFSGYTDALTALRLGEASCNGKSRLFAALARRLNLPARLVGGLILEEGSKRTTHQWVEIFVNGHWVPFDTINDHFAEIPFYYVSFYRGDLAMFTHTANVNFKYSYRMARQTLSRAELTAGLRSSPWNFMNLLALFERAGISPQVLKIILMLPLSALITVVFRNVIGLQTFGTFLPALIAAAARETGFLWGTVGFVAIILISALIRLCLDRLHLLHTPKMAILFTAVILLMVSMTVLGVKGDLIELAHVTLFPVAILTITAERFALIQEEQGLRPAILRLLQTLVAVGVCYAAIGSILLQNLILVFPELLLVIMALNLWLGRWTGMRVSEYYRFRHLIEESAL